jgi:N-acetylmuramoyl-L-alanine amidase
LSGTDRNFKQLNANPRESRERQRSRRRVVLLASTLAALLAALSGANAATLVNSARIWPAQEYTRITLESGAPIAHKIFTIANPHRLVLDLENVESSTALDVLSAKISPDDPYVSGVRIGRFKPGVIRLVLDLKAQVKPEVFTLKPVGDYGHRLVLDVYPVEPVDPLLALLEKKDAPVQPSAIGKPEKRAGNPGNGLSVPPAAATKPAPATDVARLITIAIDAGHGGEDPGAKGRSGTYEKHITLAIAKKLKALVDEEPNMRGVLIRNGDYFVQLADRVEKAKNINADLFVSIHADAFIKSHARGSSVFALSERGATSVAARILAEKQNQADQIGGVNLEIYEPNVQQVLVDLSQTATINDSLKLARAVLGEIGGINELHRERVEQAGFAVLKAPDIPSILVETAFLTNPDEERKLKDEKYQDGMAQAILLGIRKYFAANPPLARSKLAQN